VLPDLQVPGKFLGLLLHVCSPPHKHLLSMWTQVDVRVMTPSYIPYDRHLFQIQRLGGTTSDRTKLLDVFYNFRFILIEQSAFET
jgi:hypothetical protein